MKEENKICRKVSFLLGGFQPVGGIEYFFYDLIAETVVDGYKSDLYVWGKDNYLLRKLDALGCGIFRSPVRHGARFSIPDFFLIFSSFLKLSRSDRIVFGKLPRYWVCQMLVILLWLTGKRPDWVYVTSYRPSELWKDGLPITLKKYFSTIYVQADEFADDIYGQGYNHNFKVKVIPLLPPNKRSFKKNAGNANQKLKVISLGRLEPQKNLDYLLSIFELLSDFDLDVSIYGDGTEKEALMERSKNLSLGISFHSFVLKDKVCDVLDECDILVITSITEGQCIVALEALSRGLLLVATPVGAIPGIVSQGNFGILIPLDDSDSASRLIRQFVSAEEFSLKRKMNIVNEYGKIYNRNRTLNEYKKAFWDVSE